MNKSLKNTGKKARVIKLLAFVVQLNMQMQWLNFSTEMGYRQMQ